MNSILLCVQFTASSLGSFLVAIILKPDVSYLNQTITDLNETHLFEKFEELISGFVGLQGFNRKGELLQDTTMKADQLKRDEMAFNMLMVPPLLLLLLGRKGTHSKRFLSLLQNAALLLLSIRIFSSEKNQKGHRKWWSEEEAQKLSAVCSAEPKKNEEEEEKEEDKLTWSGSDRWL